MNLEIDDDELAAYVDAAGPRGMSMMGRSRSRRSRRIYRKIYFFCC